MGAFKLFGLREYSGVGIEEETSRQLLGRSQGPQEG